MNQWGPMISNIFLRVQEIPCKIDSLYQFQTICTELIPADFSHRPLIGNLQRSTWAHVVRALAPYFLFLSSTLFPSGCRCTMRVCFNIKCPHQRKESFSFFFLFFLYLRIRSREQWVMFVCWIHCYFPDCYLEILSYLLWSTVQMSVYTE